MVSLQNTASRQQMNLLEFEISDNLQKLLKTQTFRKDRDNDLNLILKHGEMTQKNAVLFGANHVEAEAGFP